MIHFHLCLSRHWSGFHWLPNHFCCYVGRMEGLQWNSSLWQERWHSQVSYFLLSTVHIAHHTYTHYYSLSLHTFVLQSLAPTTDRKITLVLVICNAHNLFNFFFFFDKDITWGAFGYTLSNVKFLCISKMGGIWRWILRIWA